MARTQHPCNQHELPLDTSLVPRPSLSLSSAITILEAGKKELVKREEGTNSFFPASKIVIAEESERRPGNEATSIQGRDIKAGQSA